MSLRYYGALYPTPSPCAAVEPLRQGVYWCSDSHDARVADLREPALQDVAPVIVPNVRTA